MPDKSRLRPIITVVLAVIVLAAGVGVFIFVLYTGIEDLGDSLIRVAAAGPEEINLETAGDYTVFLENPVQAAEKTTCGTNPCAEIKIQLESDSGRLIPVRAVGPNTTYSLNGRRGVSISTFKLETPGLYTVTVVYGREDAGRRPPVITMSRGFGAGVFRLVFLSIGLLLGSFVLTTLIVILGFFRRPAQTRPHRF